MGGLQHCKPSQLGSRQILRCMGSFARAPELQGHLVRTCIRCICRQTRPLPTARNQATMSGRGGAGGRGGPAGPPAKVSNLDGAAPDSTGSGSPRNACGRRLLAACRLLVCPLTDSRHSCDAVGSAGSRAMPGCSICRRCRLLLTALPPCLPLPSLPCARLCQLLLHVRKGAISAGCG